MDAGNILKHVDHTLLNQDATKEDIKAILDDAVKYHVASVCIPPCYVAYAKKYTKGAVKVGTVVGFPNGYQTGDVKVFETKSYIAQGADEIDMVANICHIKNGLYSEVLKEIRMVKEAAGDIIVKVIIETCLLTEEEKIKMCSVVSDAGADYIKTSTGFSTGGATFEDISLFQAHVASGVRIKAAGGIKNLEDAEQFLRLGADRLGTSRIVKIINKQHAEGY